MIRLAVYFRIALTRFFVVGVLLIAFGCNNSEVQTGQAEAIELQNYDVITSFNDNILANPSIVKYDGASKLFVYDEGIEQVLIMNRSGEVVDKIGRKGKGPGEYQSVSNIYLTSEYLYLVDDRQYLIHRYHLDGELDSTMDYGEIGTHRINKPLVTEDGYVLISPTVADEYVYKKVEWNGNVVTDIGEVPDGSMQELDYKIYREEVSNREVPSYFYSHAIAISTDTEPKGFFIVHEAFPKVIKYTSDGEKLWESKVSGVPEIASISKDYYAFMNKVLSQTDAIRPLRKYRSGWSKDGNLYVTTNSGASQLWIHKYNNDGELVQRIRPVSDIKLLPSVDMDLANQELFVFTEEAELRAYKL